MLFWIIIIVLAVAVAGLVTLPVWRGAVSDVGPQDIAIYRDQLAEVDRDLARGVLAQDEAARTRTEIARRVLAADKARPVLTIAPPRLGRALSAVVAAGLVLGSAGLYARLGAPGYADLPLADRLAQAQTLFANRLPQAEAEARAADGIAAGRITPPAGIADSVATIQAGLDAAPDDLPTLTLLRDFEAGTRNWPAAAALMARIVAVKGGTATADDLTVLIDLMVFATAGYVSTEAKARLEDLATMAPGSPAIPYFEGLLYSDIGRPDLAFAVWRPLAEDGSGVFAERARVMIADAAFAAGVDYAPPDGDQQARIAAMVSGLAERLASDGGPASDWARLITSFGVLGQTEAARSIWAEARTTFADDPLAMQMLTDAAIRAGVLE